MDSRLGKAIFTIFVLALVVALPLAVVPVAGSVVGKFSILELVVVLAVSSVSVD